MKRQPMILGSFVLLLLAGCSTQQATEQALESARASFEQIKDDPEALRSAPKDVVRAGESLARAEQLATYWGSSRDVAHYAYLSQRYSEIAVQQSRLAQNQLQEEKLGLQLQSLQLTLREAKLLTMQQRKEWAEEQLVSLDSSETERGLVMTLGDVLFAGGSANLTPAANRTVLKLVQFLQLNPRRVIRVEGYSDSNGEEADNLQLSRERAQSIADVLVDLGVDAKRISVAGYGEAYPVADNASTRGRAQNRRVEIVFSDQNGQMGPAR
ncbi:OmpA family protein [Pseudomonas sp. N040]|uniref:OmpA family protein n=1 Tax=Pseudomonas sp. N040 TaxID=2785325 RepID=UPI001E633843|nr:OmpA family protein [Pseudomonas sp. N040]